MSADHHAQVIVGVARGGKAFQHLGPQPHPGDEFGDDLLVVTVERDVENGRGGKARLFAIDQRRVAGNDAALFQRPAPAASTPTTTC